MKSWAWTLIILSLCGKLSKSFLPRGERSPLYSALRFLLSLCTITVIFSPLVKWGKRTDFSSDSFSFEDKDLPSGDELILAKMGQTMKNSVDTAYPDSSFTLEIYADENHIPDYVKVICEDPDTAKKIAVFIERNYGLETKTG